MWGETVESRESPVGTFLASLDVTLGRMASALERQERDAERNQRLLRAEHPRWIHIHGTIIAPSSGFQAIRLDQQGPDSGHFWYVRRLVVGGLTPTTTAAGRLDVFVTAMDLSTKTSLAQLGLADWQDQATALPLVGAYNRGELAVRAQEQLWLVLSGATSGQQYVVAGDIEDYQEGISPNILGF